MSNPDRKIFIAEPENFSKAVISELKKFGSIDFGPVNASELKDVFQSHDIFWFRLGHKINKNTVGSGPFKCKIVATNSRLLLRRHIGLSQRNTTKSQNAEG